MQRKRFPTDWRTQRVVRPADRKTSFGDFFKSAIRRYVQTTRLHGFAYLTDKQRCLLERTLWGLILLGAISFGFYMIIVAYSRFLDAPTATSKLPNRIKVSEVAFPAIGICTGNRMSKKAVMQFADLVWTNQDKVGKIVGQNVEEIFRILLLMISLYNFDVDFGNLDKLYRLHEFLAAFYGDQYPIEDIMDGFVPKCSDIFVKCAVTNHIVDCSKILEFRKTDSGRCCTFNYLRPREKTPEHLRTKRTSFHVASSGELLGVAFYLKRPLQDYAATLYSTPAMMVKIWDAYTFADTLSGGLKQIMIIPGRKYFLSITPQVNFGSPSMRDLDPINRGCIFDDEKLPQFPANYPHNDCRFLCRHQYIVNQCNCYPFHHVDSHNRSHCTLKDLPCLSKAQDNWLNAEPPVSKGRIEKRLFQCPQCIPKCDSVKYMVQTSFSFFAPEFKDEIGSNYLIANESMDQLRTRNLVHFFFSDDFVFGNEQRLTYTWYDLLSNFGGLVGLTIGGSLIGIAEMIYFFTAEFGSNLNTLEACDRQKSCLKRKPLREVQPGWWSPTAAHQIYWNELNSVYYHQRNH